MICNTIIAIVKGKNFAIEKVTKSLDENAIPYENIFDLTYYANVKASMVDTLVCVETLEPNLATKTLNKMDGILVMPTGLR
ncbi:hypothetical protein [uncultured Clostridium sp.]|uniref:hypothetical protein n=1 Tax=uncultured Clostridium sp. TaxID=59620 RepID=UPI00260D4557|nr:hypothetical protein [uncultured Clostridium sp.]